MMQPQYQTPDSAGADLFAAEDTTIYPDGKPVCVPTGAFIPKDIRSNTFIGLFIRSSLAYKYNLMLANGVGVIDADYEDEILVMLVNHSNNPVFIKKGQRIAQLVGLPYIRLPYRIKETKRKGGFGSTGE